MTVFEFDVEKRIGYFFSLFGSSSSFSLLVDPMRAFRRSVSRLATVYPVLELGPEMTLDSSTISIGSDQFGSK